VKPIKLKPSRQNGKWVLNIPPAISPDGKRKRLFFKTQDAAEREAAPLREKHHMGETATILPPHLARLAQKAFELLGDLPNEDILHAAAAWRDSRDLSARSPTMRELFAAWRTVKIRKPKFIARLGQLERRCNGLLEIKVCDLTPGDIEAHALGDAAPAHRNQILRELRGMLNHATRKLWRQGVNPISTIGFTDIRKGLTQVYTPEEVSRILKTTAEIRDDFIPSLALMIFAGVRPEQETLKITWEEIDLAEGFVDICGDTAKRDRRRHIHIEPVLREWLLWYIRRHGKQTGRVCPWSKYRSIQRNRDLILEQANKDLIEEHERRGGEGAPAKLKHHPDVYRHTWASCHLCHIGDLNRLVLEIGHEGGPEILHRHYFRMVKKSDAALFWRLTPKIVLAS
jgi:integrase/recombinase XerD